MQLFLNEMVVARRMLQELDKMLRVQKISVLEAIDKFAAEQGIDLGPSEQCRRRRERLRS